MRIVYEYSYEKVDLYGDGSGTADGKSLKLLSELKQVLHCSFALQDSCLSISMVHGALNIAIFTTRREAPSEIECKHITHIATVLRHLFVDISTKNLCLLPERI